MNDNTHGWSARKAELSFLRERKEAGIFGGEGGVGGSICQSRGCPLKAELTASGFIHLQLPFRFVMKTETC